jgi:Flp pilus assembly protein TadG
MKNNQKGTALVELALILPLLLLLTFITTEFGRAMYEYNAVTKSTRDAVRYLSFQTPGAQVSQAQNLMVYGKLNPTSTDKPLVRGLTLANVPAASCCTWQLEGTNPVINTVTVRVTNYTYQAIFPSVFGIAFGDAAGNLTFSTITATMRAAT